MRFTTGMPLGGFATLRERYNLLREENERLKGHALHALLENLILTETDQEGAARELTDYLGRHRAASCFALLLIYADELRHPPEGVDLFEIIERSFTARLGTYTSLVFWGSNAPRNICCLVIQDHLTQEDVELLQVELAAEIAELCTQAAEDLRAQGILARVAVSTLQIGTENIKKLYREAMVTRDHSYDSSKPVTTSYDLDAIYSADDKEFNLPAMERQYQNYVMGRQFFNAVTVLDDIIDYTITASRPTLEHLASSLFMRLETVLAITGIEQMPPPVGNTEIGGILANLMTANDFGQIRDYVHDFFALLGDAFVDIDSGSKINKVTEYINENYRQHSMGAALICREFKFSASYLSRLFKAEYGTSVVDYIHSIRVEKAKELLSKTDDTIDNVATQVGFTNRWTFIRVFKEREGITPGVYRGAPH